MPECDAFFTGRHKVILIRDKRENRSFPVIIFCKVFTVYIDRFKTRCMQVACVLLCSGNIVIAHSVTKQANISQTLHVSGTWILEEDQSSMIDPQTSGLSFYEGKLYSVSDGSAHASQIRKLHVIDPASGKIESKLGSFVLSEQLKSSCFASYLNARPDYEGLVAIPNEQNAWLLVTEDATRSGNYSSECRQQFAATGSTDYPSLLVKVVWQNKQLMVTGVRALQFAAADKVGNFPNDGIEGITITRDGRILLGLEKDQNTKARVFELPYTPDMFEHLDSFLPVIDSGLWLPDMGEGNHPINGMDVYYPTKDSAGFLIAAARNDDQLWIIDLAKKQATKILDVVFNARCGDGTEYKIAIAAIEGVAVHDNTLYLINDPWKKVYLGNSDMTACPSDHANYVRMSPLLFTTPLDKCFSTTECLLDQ